MNFVFKLVGLTLAMVGFLAITIYVTYQLSFDKYHENYTSVYRVNSIRDEDGKLEKYAMVPPAIGTAIKELPEAKGVVRMSETGHILTRYNGNLVRIGGFVQADNSLFDVLTFKFIKGGKDAIDKPGTMILSISTAKRIFGTDDPIGKLISFPERNNTTLEVTAIIEDSPANTHISFNAIAPINAFDFSASIDDNWDIEWDGSVFLYVQLYPHVDVNLFEKKMQDIVRRNIAKYDDGREKRFGVFLQPIAEIYLSPPLKMEFIKKGNAFYVYVFTLLGVFLVVMACINYVNLSIADYYTRSKEIGIRKILGARRNQIAFQFVCECLFYCSLSLLLSLGILFFIFPHVSARLEPDLDFVLFFQPRIVLILAITILAIVVLSTAYLAIKLSIHSPVKDLKKDLMFGSNLTAGKMLLLNQFVISATFIFVTIGVSRQVNFIKMKDPGFDRANLITLSMPDEYQLEKAEVLKTELKALAEVEHVSFSYYLVTGVPYLNDWYKVEIGNSMKQIRLNEIFVDHDFFETMNIRILEGRGFDVKNKADFNTAFIVNETAAREFGWDDAVGKRISYGYGEAEGEKWEGTVVGLSEDFNTRSLHYKIEPLVIRLPFDEWPGMSLNVKLRGEMKEAVAAIKAVYERVLPGYLLDYDMVEDIYNNQYRDEAKSLSALQLATGMVLMISCFGVFSLSLFMSMKRMKEFGIRKVLGATVSQIALLNMGYFLRIAATGLTVSLPISYWLMSEWLDRFAYRVQPDATIFLIAVTLLLSLVVMSSGYSSVKASWMNPVNAIKME